MDRNSRFRVTGVVSSNPLYDKGCCKYDGPCRMAFCKVKIPKNFEQYCCRKAFPVAAFWDLGRGF